MIQSAAVAGHSRPDANVTVAKNIRAELALADATQAELATYLGENEMWVSRRMKSAPPFSVNELVAVADFFGISAVDLLTPKPRGNRPTKPLTDLLADGIPSITGRPRPTHLRPLVSTDAPIDIRTRMAVNQ